MNEDIKNSLLFLVPGVVSVVIYWNLWRVERRWIDFLATFVIFVFFIQGAGRLVGIALYIFAGSPLMFAAWGDEARAVSATLLGIGVTLFMSYWYRRHGDDDGALYPWYPIPVK